MTRINVETIELILSNISEDKRFVCHDGKVLGNLKELGNELEKMNGDVFSYHVDLNKNDFSTWIYDCIGDSKLAEDIREAKDAKDMSKKVKMRIIYLKKNSKGII